MTFQTAPRNDWINPEGMIDTEAILQREGELAREQRKGRLEEFKDKWGLDPTEALRLTKNTAFMKMIKHLDHVWMEFLRNDDQTEAMFRHQGAARIVGDMLDLPNELEGLMKETENTE